MHPEPKIKMPSDGKLAQKHLHGKMAPITAKNGQRMAKTWIKFDLMLGICLSQGQKYASEGEKFPHMDKHELKIETVIMWNKKKRPPGNNSNTKPVFPIRIHARCFWEKYQEWKLQCNLIRLQTPPTVYYNNNNVCIFSVDKFKANHYSDASTIPDLS